MSAITLHLVSETDAAEVLHFETENRAFFERTVAGFGDDYYTLETARCTLAARVLEREEGDSYFYLIRDPAGELVGCVSLFGVQRGPVSRRLPLPKTSGRSSSSLKTASSSGAGRAAATCSTGCGRTACCSSAWRTLTSEQGPAKVGAWCVR